MSNTDLWDALGKTDPSQTKRFSRAGGFKGTATKPIWVYLRLTEQFGPVGEGWGHNKPDYQVVPGADGEVLVYCTVECWHGVRVNTFHGVGGDKVVVKDKNGLRSNDEAFKAAFTDAVMNAFKSVGVAADVHMGLFDDDKYVAQMEREFAPEPEIPASVEAFLNGLRDAYATNSAEVYWGAHWPAVDKEWRPYALEQKELIKNAQGKVAMLRAG